MLIYCMGGEAEAIVTQIYIRAPRAADQDNNIVTEDAEGTLYVRTPKAFGAYFNPRDNHLHYGVLFMSRTQQ
jgi:hypothetical protein